MKWSYKTVHFELKKEGLLGGSFLDETEVEERLNDFGRSGWELTSVIEVQDGIIAFFKQPLDLGFSSRPSEAFIDEEESDRVIEEPFAANEFYETEDNPGMQQQILPQSARRQEQYDFPEAHDFVDQSEDSGLIPEQETEEPVTLDDDSDSYENQVNNDEEDNHRDQRGIGAIRIE